MLATVRALVLSCPVVQQLSQRVRLCPAGRQGALQHTHQHKVILGREVGDVLGDQ